MNKILYIGGFELPDKNAAAQRVMANAKLLREMGFEVSFIGISKAIEQAPDIVEGFDSCPVPYPITTRQWIHQICSFLDTSVIIGKKPDFVILYNFPSIASLRILKACHKHRIKVIHDITEWESNSGWTLKDIIRKIDINLRMRYCTKKMDGVIAISRYLYNYYTKYTKTILIPPTIDIQDIKWNRQRELSTGNMIKLIYAGNAGFGKKDRLDIIINAIAQFGNMKLDVIGMTEQQYIYGYGELPEVCNNVVFHGRVTHIEAIQAVQNADFQFIIRDSNLKNNAGFPTKLVESFTCCTPVIATLTSNIGDYLKDGLNGYIVDKNCSIVDVLHKILNLSKYDIIQMKKNCKSCLEFDYRNYRNEFNEIFQ